MFDSQSLVWNKELNYGKCQPSYTVKSTSRWWVMVGNVSLMMVFMAHPLFSLSYRCYQCYKVPLTRFDFSVVADIRAWPLQYWTYMRLWRAIFRLNRRLLGFVTSHCICIVYCTVNVWIADWVPVMVLSLALIYCIEWSADQQIFTHVCTPLVWAICFLEVPKQHGLYTTVCSYRPTYRYIRNLLFIIFFSVIPILKSDIIYW